MNYFSKNNQNLKITAIFGGTFDPIHYGHLIPIERLAIQIGLKNIILIPNNQPTYRIPPKTNIMQRLHMINLAIQNHPLFTIDTREIKHKTFTNTIETLKSFRKEIGWNNSLIYIIGQDSLLSLYTWYKWSKILNFCHLIVCARPGYMNIRKHFVINNWINDHIIYNHNILHKTAYGYIYFSHTPLLNISSTIIRNYKLNNYNFTSIMPSNVLKYIYKYNIY
uniref:Probable nicotinate-nucleotide adenylyltransferase n=1 Tax=Candidatus Aschnera chinzeii TaxID=1485666 RepID=A0AAT9G4J0_9ENTR|nr:MAG: nicotinate-nucleotide adenylyltransferase [Candidatus Aschnera chinzeii]